MKKSKKSKNSKRKKKQKYNISPEALAARNKKIAEGMRRYRANQSKEEVHQMMEKVRDNKTPESYINQKYSKKSIASLRKHMREKVNTPRHYRTRNDDFHRTPEIIKLRFEALKKAHQARLRNYVVCKIVPRVNDHCGVITTEEMESL
jgi:hypothetical protein